jgi:2-methylcitrate dehydratase
MTIAEQLAAYAASLRYEQLPSEVVHQVKRMMVDTLGCAIGGYHSGPGEIARSMADEITSTRPATILCSGRQSSVELAAFANDVMVRYLDFNDGYTGLDAGHPSDSIPGLLAAAEMSGASGRELIVAIVLAYEVFCRFCDTLEIRVFGFDHATLGALATAVGAARLLGCSERQIRETVNLTVAANITLYQTRIQSVSMWKGCAYANANRNALFAARLAARGVTGPSPVFEGRAGYFKAVSRQPLTLARFGGDGEPFKIMQCLIKKFPLGQYSQSVAQAALEARSFVGDVENVEHVEVRTLATAVHMMAGDPEKWRPENRETADHSMPYTAAIALIHDPIQHHHFEEKYFRDPAVLALVERIGCVVSEEANALEPEAMLCELEVVLRSGERRTFRVEHHRGHWKNPMSDAEIEDKYRLLASTVLSTEQADRLLAQVWNLENVDAGTLVRSTVASN